MRYIVNEETKEHRVFTPGHVGFGKRMEVPPPPGWRVRHATNDGWILWDGKENPLPEGSRCDVLMYGRKNVPNVVAHRAQEWEGVSHYRPAFQRENDESAAPAWNGVIWPPPVGSYVECAGFVALIVHVSADGYVVGWDDKHKVSGTMDRGSCRPVRSAEDEAVHAMRAQDCEPFEGMLSRHDFCRAIYRAIRDGQIPGVRLEADAT